MRLSRTLIACACLPLALAACSSPSGSPAAPASPGASGADGGPVVVATTTQLGSIVGDITRCAGTSSHTLMGPGDDPHDFSVASSEVATMVKAPLVVTNGLGLEGALESTLESARADGATVYEVAPHLDPLSWADIESTQADAHAGHDHAGEHADESAGEHAEGDGHAHGEYDPHVHMDVARMARAAGLIGAELAKVTGDAQYETCGQQVETELEGVHAEVRQILDAVPQAKRVMVTDHAAYNYFADTYGWTVAGVVIPGGSTDAQPNSAELAELVEVVRDDHVSVLVSNNALSPALVETVAKESGTDVKVVQLFEGSVGPAGSGAESYADMMLTNARALASALK